MAQLEMRETELYFDGIQTHGTAHYHQVLTVGSLVVLPKDLELGEFTSTSIPFIEIDASIGEVDVEVDLNHPYTESLIGFRQQNGEGFFVLRLGIIAGQWKNPWSIREFKEELASLAPSIIKGAKVNLSSRWTPIKQVGDPAINDDSATGAALFNLMPGFEVLFPVEDAASNLEQELLKWSDTFYRLLIADPKGVAYGCTGKPVGLHKAEQSVSPI